MDPHAAAEKAIRAMTHTKVDTIMQPSSRSFDRRIPVWAVIVLAFVLLGWGEIRATDPYTSPEFVVGYFASSWRDAVAFGFLIIVLLVRPQGLLGKFQAEKV